MKTTSLVGALMAGSLFWTGPALAQRISWSISVGGLCLC